MKRRVNLKIRLQQLLSVILTLSSVVQPGWSDTSTLPVMPAHLHSALASTGPTFHNRARNVFLIEDIHVDFTAQKDLARLIQDIQAEHPIELIGLEGAFGPMDLDLFRLFPSPYSVRMVADYYFRHKKISGAVYSLLAQQRPLPAVLGVDDLAHYRANVQAYQRSIETAATYERRLSARRQQLQTQKQQLFSPALWSFDQAAEAYHDGHLQLRDYVTTLSSTRQSLKLSGWADDNILALLQNVFQQSQSSDEFRRLLRKISAHLSITQQQELVAYLKTVTAKSQSMDGWNKSFDSEKFEQELRQNEVDIYHALIENAQQQELVDESRRITLQTKLCRYALTPSEWQEYKLTRDTGFLANWRNRYIRDCEVFYEQAEARNFLIARNFSKAVSAAASANSILVVGGFHAAYIRDSLQADGFTVHILRVNPQRGLDPHFSSMNIFRQRDNPTDRWLSACYSLIPPPVMTDPNAFAQSVVLNDLALGRIATPLEVQGELNDLHQNIAVRSISQYPSHAAITTKTQRLSEVLGPTEIESIQTTRRSFLDKLIARLKLALTTAALISNSPPDNSVLNQPQRAAPIIKWVLAATGIFFTWMITVSDSDSRPGWQGDNQDLYLLPDRLGSTDQQTAEKALRTFFQLKTEQQTECINLLMPVAYARFMNKMFLAELVYANWSKYPSMKPGLFLGPENSFWPHELPSDLVNALLKDMKTMRETHCLFRLGGNTNGTGTAIPRWLKTPEQRASIHFPLYAGSDVWIKMGETWFRLWVEQKPAPTLQIEPYNMPNGKPIHPQKDETDLRIINGISTLPMEKDIIFGRITLLRKAAQTDPQAPDLRFVRDSVASRKHSLLRVTVEGDHYRCLIEDQNSLKGTFVLGPTIIAQQTNLDEDQYKDGYEISADSDAKYHVSVGPEVQFEILASAIPRLKMFDRAHKRFVLDEIITNSPIVVGRGSADTKNEVSNLIGQRISQKNVSARHLGILLRDNKILMKVLSTSRYVATSLSRVFQVPYISNQPALVSIWDKDDGQDGNQRAESLASMASVSPRGVSKTINKSKTFGGFEPDRGILEYILEAVQNRQNQSDVDIQKLINAATKSASPQLPLQDLHKNFALTILRAQQMNINLVIDKPLDKETLQFAQDILEACEMLPIDFLRKSSTPITIEIGKIEDQYTGGAAELKTGGFVRFDQKKLDVKKMRRMVVWHEILHHLAVDWDSHSNPKDLLFTSEDWRELYRLEERDYVFVGGHRFPIDEVVDPANGIENIARMIRNLSGEHFFDVDDPQLRDLPEEQQADMIYAANPHEALVWSILGESKNYPVQIGKKPEAIRALAERHLLRVGDHFLRFDSEHATFRLVPIKTPDTPATNTDADFSTLDVKPGDLNLGLMPFLFLNNGNSSSACLMLAIGTIITGTWLLLISNAAVKTAFESFFNTEETDQTVESQPSNLPGALPFREKFDLRTWLRAIRNSA